jgi:hypothetical protein
MRHFKEHFWRSESTRPSTSSAIRRPVDQNNKYNMLFTVDLWRNIQEDAVDCSRTDSVMPQW